MLAFASVPHRPLEVMPHIVEAARSVTPGAVAHNPSRRSGALQVGADTENSSPRARPPDYDESSARRDHQASAAVIALSASWIAVAHEPCGGSPVQGYKG